MTVAEPSDLVMRDLVDTLIQENLGAFADRTQPDPPSTLTGQTVQPGELWCRIDLASPAGAWVCFRVRPAAALQPYRLSRPPVWHGASRDGQPRRLQPDELLELLAADQLDPATEAPHARQIGADLRTAVQHAAVIHRERARLTNAPPRPGELITAERIAATRNRPFHPTARAATGWTAQELARYGPMRHQPLGLGWVAVRRNRLRHGSGAASDRLHELLLDEADRQHLADAIGRAGLHLDDIQPLPVHPWHLAHVLPTAYAAELAARDVVPLIRGLGRFHPTASLRTLALDPLGTVPETELHVKLPLGVTTLGATRLLPPRYLDNGQRAQRTMQQLIDRCPVLRARVQLCDERTWCGWHHPSDTDEFDDRPGQLAAQVRVYPAGLFDDPAQLVLPMATLAAHEWDVLGPVIDPAGFSTTDAVEFFHRLAEAFCEVGLGFLRYGVLPELHGQNIVVALQDGVPHQFVLRDHDTLRLYPGWMIAANVPDPGYRITPGAPQSLRLSGPEELLGYLQTLGFQVNLYGIADALSRHFGIDEAALWATLRKAVVDTLARVTLPSEVADMVERELLRAPTWPSRLVLGPLLRLGPSRGVSMPAGIGRVPNPLAPVLPARRARSRVIAERAARQRLLNAFLRETGVPTVADGALLRVTLPESGCVLLAKVEHWSVLGHHAYDDEFQLQPEGGETVPVGHSELVAVLLTELAAVATSAADDPQARRRCQAELAVRIDNSVARTTRYLQRSRPLRPAALDPRALTRHAEQSLLFGHPFHPTPKSAEGFTAEDLAAYAPELGASFALHYVAIAPELLVEDRLPAASWVPAEVQEQAEQLLGADRGDYALLPVHPWQAGYLRQRNAVDALLANGGLVALGPLGRAVYPTSSVRTVCDPTFAISWKLPLHVRITNFVRNNPGEHARRAVDASRLIQALRPGWGYEGFEVLVETGYRTIDHTALAADITVLYRENPFATRPEAPQVMAGLLEDGPDGEEPELIRYVRQATGRPVACLPADHVAEWLRRYLEISLLPLLAMFSTHGISLEAHVQNSLLHLEGGWPARFWVRDMEGTSVSRPRWAAIGPHDAIPADSPVLYHDTEAWLRLKYYAVTNHLGHLLHILGRHTRADESRLWRVVRDVVRTAQSNRYAHDLLVSPVLPAKANLTSCFAGRGERPLYVDIPNPIYEVRR